MTAQPAHRTSPRSLSSKAASRLGAAVLLLLTLPTALLTGCGMGSPAVTVSGQALTGRVHGGQQPVSGARVQLYAAGSTLTGNGTGAIDLTAAHTITTDGSGAFNITGDYLCPTSATQVYLVARGGNPGLAPGTSNPALVLMASLGSCGNLTASTDIFVDEVTTVASAWGLAQFMAPGAVVGSSLTNAIGLANAFTTVANLADTQAGISPGSAMPTGGVTEPAKINTLADAIATCVNSDGSSPCTPLFAAATYAGVVPANTLDAALAIVKHPAANVATVFALPNAQSPFLPVLSKAPSDWTLSVTYGNCTTGCGGLLYPQGIGFDAAGNIWAANYSTQVVSALGPGGIPLAAGGFPGAGLHNALGLTLDTQSNIWISNENSVTGANNSHYGSVSKFASSGAELSGYGYTGGGVYFPQALAATPAGNIWVADYGSSTASLLANSGTGLSSANGYAPSQIPFTTAVTSDAAGNGWFGYQNGGVARVTALGTVTLYPGCCSQPTGLAFDQTGNLWVADYSGFRLVELNSSGIVLHTVSTAVAFIAAQALAVDGTGNIWAGNYLGNSVTQLRGTDATMLSPATGYGRDALLDEPYGLAIDASGNVWLSNSGDMTLTAFVGLASPVRTPTPGPPSAP